MRKSFSSSLAVVALVLGVSVTALAQGPPPTLVETAQVTEQEFKDQITLVGRSEARINGSIVAEVTGRVVEIPAPEGNPVTKGTPLVRIAPEQIRYSLQAKEGEAKQARTQAELAKANFARAETLFKQELIRQATYDSIMAWTTVAEARFAQIDAERKRLQLDYDNCTIRAPYDGHTLRRAADVGEWVNPGTPVYEMVDLSTITIQVDLPERHYGHLEAGGLVAITISNEPDMTYQGTVTGIVRNASAETHTFPVIISVDNPDGQIGGGKLVRATLTLNKTFHSLAVSKDAIVRDGTRTMIYTIADGKAAPMPVRTSSTDGEMIAIEGQGISAGMTVVVRGNERIFPGSPVRVAGEEQQSSAAAQGQESQENH